MRWREREGVRWLEAELPGARAAFSTRTGGASEPPFDSLNLGLLSGDRREPVLENRRQLAGALELQPENVLMGLQVHGGDVTLHSEQPQPSGYANPAPNPEETDGHATAVPGLAPLVLVADCLPVALVGPRGVAMVHCGWRGLAAGIVASGVAAVQATAGAIGPGIGPCCYEVGTEVLEALAPVGAGFAKGRMLDLPAVAKALLQQAGVEQIESSDLCTSCEADLFFSHRRDGERTGRQSGVAWLRG